MCLIGKPDIYFFVGCYGIFYVVVTLVNKRDWCEVVQNDEFSVSLLGWIF